jgi:hypothetical protein
MQSQLIDKHKQFQTKLARLLTEMLDNGLDELVMTLLGTLDESLDEARGVLKDTLGVEPTNLQ